MIKTAAASFLVRAVALFAIAATEASADDSNAGQTVSRTTSSSSIQYMSAGRPDYFQGTQRYYTKNGVIVYNFVPSSQRLARRNAGGQAREVNVLQTATPSGTILPRVHVVPATRVKRKIKRTTTTTTTSTAATAPAHKPTFRTDVPQNQ